MLKCPVSNSHPLFHNVYILMSLNLTGLLNTYPTIQPIDYVLTFVVGKEKDQSDYSKGKSSNRETKC